MSTVPELVRGAWRRRSITYPGGATDTSSFVLWSQLDSEMVDVRVDPITHSLTGLGSIADATIDQLRALAGNEASTGLTRCTDIEVDANGVRRATAEWITRRPGDIALHPVTAYPEPGLLEWSDDGATMLERAPSGAYVEVWDRVEDADGPLHRVDHPDGARTYRTGGLAVLVRPRPAPLDGSERLDALLAEAGDDRTEVERLVGCEFSVAELRAGSSVIVQSTLPWRVGEQLDVDP